jgi:hypothetical protein
VGGTDLTGRCGSTDGQGVVALVSRSASRLALGLVLVCGFGLAGCERAASTGGGMGPGRADAGVAPDVGSPGDAGGDADLGPTPDTGSDAGPDDAAAGDAGDRLPADSYCERTADVFCPYYLRCGRIVADDLDDCRRRFAASCENRYEARYAQLAEAGVLELSASGVEACRTHLETVECAQQLGDLDGPCGLMWRGLQPVGGGCGLDVESLVCASGSRCVLGLALCGECRLESPVGGLCGGDTGRTCAAGLSCDEGVCGARRSVGEPCDDPGARCVLGAQCEGGVCRGPSYVGLGEACGARVRCPYGAVCRGGVCVEMGANGDACDAPGTCAAGYCMGGRCWPTKREDEPCERPDECRSGYCTHGTCTALPTDCL